MPRRIGKDNTKVDRGHFPRSKKSFSSQLEKLLAKYEQRNMLLQEKEANVRTRVEMMEAAMPVLLAWNMYQNCVEETESNDTQVTTCPIWFSDQKPEQIRAGSESDIQKRKEELDRLIREIRRREKLDRSGEDVNRDGVVEKLVEDGGSVSTKMSRDLAEIKEIRREKTNLEKLIRSYQRRNEELKAKEAILIKKIETMEPGLIDWKDITEDRQNTDGYILGDPTFEVINTVETQQTRMEKIARLREEVLQKQYENLKLEKELEARKEEHRLYYEMLSERKTALNQCIDGECSDLEGNSHNTTNAVSENKTAEQSKEWDEIGTKYDT